jgi:catechol 2,3-dioxygenase-like lactoylglutathione lyase family enzyme
MEIAEVDEGAAQLVVEVYVRDLDRSLAFYRAFGFVIVRRTADFAVLRWDRCLLFLDERPDIPDAPDRERVNLRILVPDVDQLWQQAHALGVPISTAVGDRDYGLRDFTVRDPDGFGLRFATQVARRRT